MNEAELRPAGLGGARKAAHSSLDARARPASFRQTIGDAKAEAMPPEAAPDTGGPQRGESSGAGTARSLGLRREVKESSSARTEIAVLLQRPAIVLHYLAVIALGETGWCSVLPSL